jgi:hypothetical protein
MDPYRTAAERVEAAPERLPFDVLTIFAPLLALAGAAGLASVCVGLLTAPAPPIEWHVARKPSAVVERPETWDVGCMQAPRAARCPPR